jgi:hypothetical protein
VLVVEAGRSEEVLRRLKAAGERPVLLGEVGRRSRDAPGVELVR